MVEGCLHGSQVPTPRGLRLDIAQSPKGGCLGCSRHRGPINRHPLRRRLVYQLDCPRGEVHRLRHAILPRGLDLFRLSPPGYPPRRMLSPRAPRMRLKSRAQCFGKFTPLSVHHGNGLCVTIEVCSSAKVSESSGLISVAYDNQYSVRTYPGL